MINTTVLIVAVPAKHGRSFQRIDPLKGILATKAAADVEDVNAAVEVAAAAFRGGLPPARDTHVNYHSERRKS